MTIPILVWMVLILFAFIAGLAIANRVLFKISVRNVRRRKVNTVIVVAGLLVGTAIISSSLVVGDTMHYLFVKDVYDKLDLIDELVEKNKTESRGYDYFNYDDYNIINGTLPREYVDGISPLIIENVPVYNSDEELASPSVNVIGFDPKIDRSFGLFTNISGEQLDGADLIGNSTIINQRCAEDLNAKVGQHLVIRYVETHNYSVENNTTTLTISHIVKNEGKANYQIAMNLFVNISLAMEMFNKSNLINLIKISNKGDVESGVQYTTQVKAAVENIITTHNLDLRVSLNKQDGLEEAEAISDIINQVFTILGMFSIIAGIMLVINIFVLLAEERKSEMGISRAVGMKRRHLVQMYLFEGIIYAILAAFIGTFVGLGIAYLIILAFGRIFRTEGGIAMPFHFENWSLILAFCAGLIITFITVLLSSWVVSKLNIIRAIKNIPEPGIAKASRKHILIGIFLAVIGIFMTYFGVAELYALYFMVGPCLIALGLAMIFMRFVSARLTFSIAGLTIIVWILQPYEILSGTTGGMEMFIASGVLLVTGAIILVMFNSNVILNVLTKLFEKKKSSLPVLKTALSYPMKKKFRTGMTLAMFALIIFTVTVVAMIASIQRNDIENTYREQSGGYDIIGVTNPNTPILDIRNEINRSTNLSGKFASIGTASVAMTSIYKYGESQDNAIEYRILGFDEELIDKNQYTFNSIAFGYTNARAVWDAIKLNDSLVVIDGTVIVSMDYGPAPMSTLRLKACDKIMVRNMLGTYSEKIVIGILNEVYFFTGVITSDTVVQTEFGVQFPSMYFFKVNENIKQVSLQLKREFRDYGMQTYNLRELIESILKMITSVMTLIEAFLGLGLIVGIAGLGIITIRSVVERRQEIGMMRAIGFKRNMVAKSFLLELSFIAFLGITTGVILGILLSYHIFQDFYQSGSNFYIYVKLIPWSHILVITGIAYIATVLCTISSAIKASRIPPAEALRYIG